MIQTWRDLRSQDIQGEGRHAPLLAAPDILPRGDCGKAKIVEKLVDRGVRGLPEVHPAGGLRSYHD